MQKFLLTANNDIKKKKIDYAVFWSLSGINSTAKAYFDELNNNLKQNISIKDECGFQKILIEIGLITNESSIENNIKNITKETLQKRDLVFYQNKWYFIQFLGNSSKATYFFVLDSWGNPVEDIIPKGIRKITKDLKKFKLILLYTKNRVLEFLMYNDSSTIEEIVKGIKETKIDIKSVLDQLLEQNLIKQDKEKYFLNNELEAFLKIAREFLKDKKIKLMKSPYLNNSLNGNQIMSYIENRFFLKLSSENKKVLQRINAVSPSALQHSLFGSIIPQQNLVEQYNENITEKIYDENFRLLLTDLCLWFLSDFKNNMVLGIQDTKAIDIDIKLKMATSQELFFAIEAKGTTMLARAGGKIKPGEMVVAKNPQLFLETSIIFYHFNQKEKAIEQIDKALKIFENKGDWIYTAYFNKAWFHYELEQFKESYNCYKKIQKIFPEKINSIKLNFSLVLIEMKKIREAKKLLKEALQQSPDNLKILYAISRIKIIENKKKECYDLLEKILKQEKEFIKLIKQEKEFSKIRKTKTFLKLLEKLKINNI